MLNESMIKSFLILAHTSSFTEAANQSFFTQQAISKQIAKMEKELKCTLFYRSRGGVTLTPEGEIYFKAFSQSMDLVEQAADEVARIRGGQENQIRLGYLEMLIVDPVWNTFVHHFRSRYPNTDVHIESFSDGDVIETLLKDEVDAAIFFLEEDEAKKLGLSFIKLGGETDEVQLCINRNYPGALKATNYMDLVHVPLLFPGKDAAKAVERVQRIGFPPENIRYNSNISSALVSVNMLEGAILVGNHCEFRDNPNLLFFEVPDHGAGTKLLWKTNNKKRVLRQMMEQFQIYQAETAGRG